MALDRGGELPLSLRGRLLVILASAQLGEQPRLLDGALEAAHGHFEGLVFLDAYGRHSASWISERGGLYQNPFNFMLILGVESSCDETGLALYDAAAGRLLAQAVHSQTAMHQAYGGVVPELASRDHLRRLVPLARNVLESAGKKSSDLAAIGYTEGPGLAGALLAGAA